MGTESQMAQSRLTMKRTKSRTLQYQNETKGQEKEDLEQLEVPEAIEVQIGEAVLEDAVGDWEGDGIVSLQARDSLEG